MTTSVTFETAAFADALKRAQSCAPKPQDGDHATRSSAGILIDVAPGTKDPIRISASDQSIFYDEWVAADHIEGPPVTWRVSSIRLAGLVSSLPIGVGRTLTLTGGDSGQLQLTSGRSEAGMLLMDSFLYQHWEPYGEEGTVVVSSLGERINQVSWACSKEGSQMGMATSGILFTGTHLFASDGKRAAMVPCEVPLANGPVTVPASTLGRIIRQSGQVRLGSTGKKLTVSPDESTQISCVILDKNLPYPGFISHPYSAAVAIDKSLLVDTIKRMMNVTRGGSKDDVTIVQFTLGTGELGLYVEASEGGEWVRDAIEIPGQAQHEPMEFRFVPQVLLDSISKAPADNIVFCYDVGAKNAIVRIDGGAGYMSWFVQWKWKGSMG